MLESRERNNLQQINCWDFVGCKRGSGLCRASFNTSANGINHGKNGGRICWAISGTFSGEKIEGLYAKKLLSCRSCKFFKSVRDEEGSTFSSALNKINMPSVEASCEV